jgi:hypothetical protein
MPMHKDILASKFGLQCGFDLCSQFFNQHIAVKDVTWIYSRSSGGYNLNGYLPLQAELNATQKGFRISESKGFEIYDFPIDAGLEYWNRFTYIDVPILAKAKVGNDIIKVYGAIVLSSVY